MNRRTRALPLLLAAVMLVCSAMLGGSTLAALNSPSYHDHAGTAQSFTTLNAAAYQNPANPQDVNVALGNNFFNPQVITITVGTTVVWTNPNTRSHTVTADDNSFDSGNMGQNAVFTHTFSTAGTFGYYCVYHGTPGTGMYGTVIVQGGGPTSTPTSPAPTNTATNTPQPPTATATAVPATATATQPAPTVTLPAPTATPNPNNHIIASNTLGQDLQMSTVPGFGSLNVTLGGSPFGTSGYVLLNYRGGPDFVSCPCPLSPNSNDFSLLDSNFSGVSISITRGSGLSQPITQTQQGGSLFLNTGTHVFSGLYDQGPDNNNQTMRLELTNLPSTPFRITVYNNNNPGNGGRSGTMMVMNQAGSATQVITYSGGQGVVTQWLVAGSSSLSIIQTNVGTSGNLPLGGIMFDDGDGSGATPTVTNTPLATNTPLPPTATDTPLPTVTPGGPTLTPTASPIPSATETLCPIPFTDINGNVFYNAITYLYCRGVVNGTGATTYGPAGTSTRAQFAKVVVLGFGLPNYTPAAPDFTDVPANYFAYSFIEAGYHAGILSGFDAATCNNIGAQPPCYGPNRPITRAQLTKLVVAAGHFIAFTPTTPTFSDVGTNNIFYVSIETAHHYSIINGYADNTFRPNNNIRRDEMAQIVYKGVTTAP